MSTERFARLFSGFENVYGQYSTQNANTLESGKVDGKAWTKKGSPEWQKHLTGQVGLGIIPLRINNTVKFAVIDIDVYKLDHKKLLDKIHALGLPLVMCRSKSGGAHLYVFFEEEVGAAVAIDMLEEWASALGHGGCEVFPKQTSRASPEDIGNWINLPYFGGDMTMRYAYSQNGSKLTLEQFLDYAELKLQTKKSFTAIKIGIRREAQQELDLLHGAPPCMKIAQENGGFPEGTRNNSMFNAGVYARKRWPDGYDEKLVEINQLLCNPPLDELDMRNLLRSLEKKESYEMRCNGPYCNKKHCRSASFGRGPMVADLGFDVGSVTKIEGDTSTWYITIEGRRVRMTTKDLMAQSRFNERCVDTINLLSPMVPHGRWVDFIQADILGKADIIQLPREATFSGQFWFRFTQFCHSMGLKATTVDEIMIGKIFPITIDDIIFLPSSLFDYLAEARFKYDSPEQIWAELLDKHVKQETVTVSNSQVEVWRIKQPTQIRPEVNVTQQKEAF